MTSATEGQRRIVAAIDGAAGELGLSPGITIAHAQALVPDLHIVESAPEEDEAALRKLAGWCMGYSPLVAPDPPDGIWIDVAGTAHLFGGEAKLMADLVRRLSRNGLRARAAVADAPGAAWGVARYGGEPVVPPGRCVDAVAGLSTAALRLPAETLQVLSKLGVDRVGQLAAMPRAPMVRRFGKEVALRLDQAFGHAFEPIDPMLPEEVPCRRLAFAEPLAHLDDLKRVVARLSVGLCRDLAKRGIGVRRLDLVCRRVDRRSHALRVGTARPSRDAPHLAKLFHERLGEIDPGFGIDEIVLVASRVERLDERQAEATDLAGDGAPDLGRLVDRLSARLGPRQVYRIEPVESAIPERSMRRVPALAPAAGLTWPEALPRPTRLVDPPEPVVATALLPDHPPAFFVWRKIRHRVVKADGPERITGEWWRSDDEVSSIRDYYRIESEQGGRFWLFRDAPADQGGRWWLHGVFA